MKSLIRLRLAFANIVHKDVQKPLGRWSIDSSFKTISRKVDYANEDHCGPCGRQITPESKVTNIPIVNKADSSQSKYYYYVL